MLQNSEIIIADTSCLILLSKIDELPLLSKLAGNVLITPEIKKEFGKELPSWIVIKKPRDTRYQLILEKDLDIGEASAIALALDLDNAILILDDLKGRNIAKTLNLLFSGTFGLILRAKQEGLIDKVRPILDKIKQTNFRFSKELFEAILKNASE